MVRSAGDCPKCTNSRVRIIETRESGRRLRRRRHCLGCDYRWTTYEAYEEEFDALDKELPELRRRLRVIEEAVADSRIKKH